MYLLPDAVVDIESLGCRAIVFNELCGPSIHEYTKGLPEGRLPWTMVQKAVSDTTDAVEYLHCCHVGRGGEQIPLSPRDAVKQKLQAMLQNYDASNVFGANMDVVQLLTGMLMRDPKERHTMRLVASAISFAKDLEKARSELGASKLGPNS
jgi:hypothetical protein